MYKSHLLGKIGESKACEYLIENNYKILERNFYCKQGELDIIAQEKDEIVFVEVKTRSSVRFGMPSEAVNNLKIKHLLSSIKYYLYVKNIKVKNIRIDVIEIYVRQNQYKINHLKQVI